MRNFSFGCPGFVAGTTIKTPNGNIPIEDIKIGDNVYAANPESNEYGIKSVTNVFVKETDTLCNILVGEEEIITTLEIFFACKMVRMKLQQMLLLCI